MSSLLPSKPQRRRRITILRRLPEELLAKVLIDLDLNSLSTVVEVLPELKERIIVILDSIPREHYVLPTALLNFKGTICLTSEFEPRKFGRPVIKIYWITTSTSVLQFGERMNGIDSDSTRWIQYIDKFAIVQIICFNPTHRARANYFLQTTGARYYYESRVRRGEITSGDEALKWSNYRPKVKESLNIKFLQRLTHKSFDKLRYLSIVCTKDAKRTLIGGISAPFLVSLKILYYDKFPLIRNCKFGYPDFENFQHSHLELIHVPASDHSIGVPADMCLTTDQELEEIDWGFAINFTQIFVNGGPDSILSFLNYYNTVTLSWRRATRQTPGAMHVESIHAPILNNFYYETLLENSVIPKLELDTELDELHIVSHAEGLNLNGIFQPLRVHDLYFIGICNYATPFVLKEEDFGPFDELLVVEGIVLHGVSLENDSVERRMSLLQSSAILEQWIIDIVGDDKVVDEEFRLKEIGSRSMAQARKVARLQTDPEYAALAALAAHNGDA